MGERINIQNLIDLLATKKGLNKRDAENFLKEMFTLIEKALETDKYIKIKGLGTFKLIDVDSRESVNVNTGARIEIQGHTKISFTPEAGIRDLINKPFAHFETVVLNEGVVFDDLSSGEEDTDKDTESENDSEEEVVQNALITEEEQPESPIESINEVIEAENPANLSTDKETTGEEANSTNASEEIKEIPEVTPIETEQPIKEVKVDNPKTEEAENKVEDKTPVSIEELILAAKKEQKIAQHSSKSYSLYYFISMIVFLTIFVAAVFTYIYNPDFIMNMLPGVNNNQKTDSLSIAENQVKEDTTIRMSAVPKKNIEHNKPAIDTTKTIIKDISKYSTAIEPDSTHFVIVGTMGTYTIHPGENLSMVSKHFYQAKALWPYIVEHNRKIIKNSNHVPIGSTLRIPALRDK